MAELENLQAAFNAINALDKQGQAIIEPLDGNGPSMNSTVENIQEDTIPETDSDVIDDAEQNFDTGSKDNSDVKISTLGSMTQVITNQGKGEQTVVEKGEERFIGINYR